MVTIQHAPSMHPAVALHEALKAWKRDHDWIDGKGWVCLGSCDGKHTYREAK